MSLVEKAKRLPRETRGGCGSSQSVDRAAAGVAVLVDQDESNDWLDDLTARAARVYGAAADHFTPSLLGFWDRFGAETVGRVSLREDETVLDLCCGAVGSALPATHALGPTEQVLGIDVAAPLLALARARARARSRSRSRANPAQR